MQGSFVPFASLGSGDPVRVLRLFHNKYSGYCCIHLLCKATYNLSLPRLSATTTTGCLQLCNAGLLSSRCSLFGILWPTAQVLYCTWLERYIWNRSKVFYAIEIITVARTILGSGAQSLFEVPFMLHLFCSNTFLAHLTEWSISGKILE